MNTSRKIKMTVELEVTIPQALTLQAMFDYWNQLSGKGSSRFVAFYADGDGNFHPQAKCTFSEELPYLNAHMRHLAVVEDLDGNRKYDFDPVAWKLSEPEEYGVMLKRIGYDNDEVVRSMVAEFDKQDDHTKEQLIYIVASEIRKQRKHRKRNHVGVTPEDTKRNKAEPNIADDFDPKS